MLQKYASAMQTLATNHWVKSDQQCDVSSESRIEWVFSHSKEYFDKGKQKEIRKEIDMAAKHEIVIADSTLKGVTDRVKDSKLELLDVGSCYNPFKKFDLFNVTSIDLCPASEDVIRCDFLNSEVIDDNLSGGILVKGHYDIVVFSLFLEYLPSSEQRYLSCVKAYNLLKPSGLLFILTPDSKHATANSKLMKSWRISLASIGFTRVYYEKLKHLHCMAFKRAVVKDLPKRWFTMKALNDEKPETMLKIPQDSLKVESTDENKEDIFLDRNEVAEDFNALPN